MGEFATYSRFHTKEEAESLLQLLDEASVDYTVDVERDVLDKVYVGETLDPMITVKIPVKNFEKVNTLLAENNNTRPEDIDPEYYLFQFSDEELVDVTRKPGEWNIFDQQLAKKLLEQRNVPVPPAPVLAGDDEYKPIRLAPVWIVLEILLAIVFWFAGIIIGLATIYAYKTLPDGRKVKIYDEATQSNGRLILIIGIIRTGIHFYLLLR